MEVKLKSHTNLHILKKIVKREKEKGWKVEGDIHVSAHEINYCVKTIKKHVTPIYYQQLIKEDAR
jgi:hypothetical protein